MDHPELSPQYAAVGELLQPNVGTGGEARPGGSSRHDLTNDKDVPILPIRLGRYRESQKRYYGPHLLEPRQSFQCPLTPVELSGGTLPRLKEHLPATRSKA